MATRKNSNTPSAPKTSTQTATSPTPEPAAPRAPVIPSPRGSRPATWTHTDEEGKKYQMVGDFGRPGTVAYHVTRPTHPDFRVGNLIVVDPLIAPEPADAVLIRREEEGLMVEVNANRRKGDVLEGVVLSQHMHYKDAVRPVSPEEVELASYSLELSARDLFESVALSLETVAIDRSGEGIPRYPETWPDQADNPECNYFAWARRRSIRTLP